MERTLSRWVHARDAVVEGAQLRVHRVVLDRLVPVGSRRRRQTPRGWITHARQLAVLGQLSLAEPLLRDALRAAAAEPRDVSTLLAAARLWVRVQLAARNRSFSARFLYELSRVASPPAELVAIRALAQSIEDALKWTPRSLERARALAPFRHRSVEQVRWGVRIFAARKLSIERLRGEVDAARKAHPRASHRSWLSRHALWRGRLRYVEERYDAAAESHETAARHAEWVTERLDATLNAASAWMEAFQFRRAVDLAQAARDEASTRRLPFYEGRAEWIARSALDRLGEPLRPDRELVHAAEHLDAPDLLLLLAHTEATIAYRLGDRRAFEELAEVARRASGVGNEPLCMATIRAMEVALSIREQSDDDARLVDRLAARGVPRLALEVAALTCAAHGLSAERKSWLRSLGASVPVRFHDHCLGVLSVNQCMTRLAISTAED